LSAKPAAEAAPTGQPGKINVPFRSTPALFSSPCSTTLVHTSQCGSSLAIPLRASDEWHRVGATGIDKVIGLLSAYSFTHWFIRDKT